ncbi:hypothetical protein ACIA6C_28080 [Streptomyces sp. NPDC051578]|uniref:hypothetical protein n=1 Tax=Streptomyces sp. NPDC051578 TaxID=3365662 RepID=UPI0037ABFA3C
MGVSDVSYMVRGRTRELCQTRLERLCHRLGAVPTSEPAESLGGGWIARAVETETAPAGEGQGRD